MNSILVLCTGNICRSPMAAARLSRALPSMEIVSAGLAACVNMPADPWALKLMRDSGTDISAHRGRQVTLTMLAKAHLVLVMELAQQRQVESLYPAARGKVWRLGHFGGVEVPDPYGAGEQMFRTSLQLIDGGVKEWGDRLTRLAHQHLAREVA